MEGNDRVKLLASRQRASMNSSVPRAERARLRFSKALQTLIDEKPDDHSVTGLPELEMFEAATELTKQK